MAHRKALHVSFLAAGSMLCAIATTPALAQDGQCTAGQWTVGAPDPNDPINSKLPLQEQSDHFAFYYDDGVASAEDIHSASQHLEYVWNYFTKTLGFPEPDCDQATKIKGNVFIGKDYGLSAGEDGVGHMGMWIGPGGLRDRFGLAHEFTHMLQVGTHGLRDSPYAGWMFESHANWLTVQLPEFRDNVHCSEMLVNFPHLYLGSTRDRYCNWQPFEYLKDLYGYEAVHAIWSEAPEPGDPGQSDADPFTVLMKTQGWDQATMNDFFGTWAMHNVTWNYTNPDGTDQGAVYRAAYGDYRPQNGQRSLRTVTLDPIDAAQGRYAVPDAQAPQRWGYNLLRVYPAQGVAEFTVNFRGVLQDAPATNTLPGLANEPDAIPQPDSGWRWGMVSVNAQGRPHYSTLQRSADGALDVAVETGFQSYWLVVMGAPTKMHHIKWDQPYYSIYRYPWMVDFDGAEPQGYQPGAPDPTPDGKRHHNGGGWVAKGAKVASSAFVGPQAKVLSGTVSDNARITDHAVIDGGTVSGNAEVGALSIVTGDTVITDQAVARTTFMPLGAFAPGMVLSGTAQNIGDIEQNGVKINHGVYYGMVDEEATKDPARGANLTAPVPEVTAKPDYRW